MVAVPGGGRNVEVHLRSLQVEFPVLEYRPFRSFSQDQSSGLLVQLFVAFDRPLHRETVQAGESLPELRTIPMVGVRMVFDWRKYLE
jgi:hypothetical protein